VVDDDSRPSLCCRFVLFNGSHLLRLPRLQFLVVWLFTLDFLDTLFLRFFACCFLELILHLLALCRQEGLSISYNGARSFERALLDHFWTSESQTFLSLEH
jgi:hypothetical protein